VVLKYKNKFYSSDDLPILLFFKSTKRKREFVNEVNNYTDFETFFKLLSVDVALAGSTVIKDKRSSLYIKFESLLEKKSLQKQLFDNIEDSNAVISTPLDIKIEVLREWIENNAEHLIS
jgi:spore coat protein CotH